jgi:hypothetical protein
VNLGENIAKLRICAHNLEIEKGRYFQINRTERFCKIYKDLEIEDVNASVCPVKNVPGVPARIDIYFSK